MKVLPSAEWESLQETLAVFSDPQAVSDCARPRCYGQPARCTAPMRWWPISRLDGRSAVRGELGLPQRPPPDQVHWFAPWGPLRDTGGAKAVAAEVGPFLSGRFGTGFRVFEGRYLYKIGAIRARQAPPAPAHQAIVSATHNIGSNWIFVRLGYGFPADGQQRIANVPAVSGFAPPHRSVRSSV